MTRNSSSAKTSCAAATRSFCRSRRRTSWPSGRPCFVTLARASAWRFGRRCSDSWKSLSPCSKIEPSTCRACRSLRLNLCLKCTQRRLTKNSSSASTSWIAATHSFYRSKRTSWPSGRPCFVSLARASAWRFGRRCSDSWKSLSLCSKIEPSTSRACRSLRLNLCLKRTP